MVTVVDPNGTPVPVYTRSGVTIVEVTANGASGSAPTPISGVSGHTIVIATAVNSSNEDVELPSGADIGDLVEVYAESNAVKVYPASGDSFAAINPTTLVDVGVSGRLFRKTSATEWRFI